jgi:hypothetical protein
MGKGIGMEGHEGNVERRMRENRMGRSESNEMTG